MPWVRRNRRVRHALILGVSLAVFWLLLSGYFTSPLLLTFGAISVAFTLYLSLRIDRHDGARVKLRLDPPIIRYSCWLLIEIVKSCIDVSILILSPLLSLCPLIFRFYSFLFAFFCLYLMFSLLF